MNALERVRIASGMTQEEIASRVGIAVSTYSMYANGHRTIPRTVAEKISVALGCKIEDIFLPEKFTVSKTTSDGFYGLARPHRIRSGRVHSKRQITNGRREERRLLQS